MAQNQEDPIHIIIDHKPHDWPEKFITGSQIKQLAGVDPSYGVWQDVPGPKDPPVGDDQKVDLSGKGVERFFTGKKTTTEGASMSMLPSGDREYLTDKGLSFEEQVVGEQKAIILREVTLPNGRYDRSTTDVLILLPSGYPDVRPDMFHTLPWVKLVPENRYPKAADQPVSFNGQNWQRWSRHSEEWRPGQDGIHTFLKRIEHALEVAQA